jgi:hypothetical protein
MNDQRGWSRDPAVSRLHRVVRWLAERYGRDPDSIASNQMIAEGTGVPVSDVITTTQLLASRGLAGVTDSMGEPQNFGAFLNAPGKELAESWAAAQSARDRRMACRDALLDWLDEQTERVRNVNTFLNDPRAFYFGQPFTPNEIRRAMSFLHEQGLIRGVTVAEGDDVLEAEITDDGRVCVEQYGGNVGAWMGRGVHRGGDTITTTITNSPGTQWMSDSPAGRQSATVTITTDARTQLLQIADQILAGMEAIDLPAERKLEATAAARELREAAADPSADKGRIRSALGTISAAALGAMGTEAGRRVLELVEQGIQALGG